MKDPVIFLALWATICFASTGCIAALRIREQCLPVEWWHAWYLVSQKVEGSSKPLPIGTASLGLVHWWSFYLCSDLGAQNWTHRRLCAQGQNLAGNSAKVNLWTLRICCCWQDPFEWASPVGSLQSCKYRFLCWHLWPWPAQGLCIPELQRLRACPAPPRDSR